MGPDGNKRKAGDEEERQREAEARYIRLLAAYRRGGSTDAALLEELEAAFGDMSLEKQREYEAGEPCHEPRDMISFDDIANLKTAKLIEGATISLRIPRGFAYDSQYWSLHTHYIWPLSLNPILSPLNEMPCLRGSMNKLMQCMTVITPTKTNQHRAAIP